MIDVTAELLRSMPLPKHEQGDNKEGRGSVLVIGGCLAVPGGILLGAEAALRTGAGKLQVATCRTIAPNLGLLVPEAMVIGLPETEDGHVAADAGPRLAKQVGRADAVLLGPGMMDEDSTAPVLDDVLAAGGEETGWVLDAGSLGLLRERAGVLRGLARTPVLTPHAGEMARMLGAERDAVEADPVRHAVDAAAELGCVVVLKGGCTHIADPAGQVWRFDGGTVGLGTSGSGDVLAGVVAGLLARGMEPAGAAVWGVFLHAEAGQRLTKRLGAIGLLARELAGEIPAIMAEAAP